MARRPPNRQHEQELWSAGCRVVAGVDEVGRGALAGPVTAAAVILPPTARLDGVYDSKALTPLARRRQALLIKAAAVAIGVGWASSSEIDRHGLTAAVALSARRALAGLGISYHAVLLDGQHDYLEAVVPVRTIVRADNCCLAVAAASIVAKVARDAYMTRLDALYPDYGFAGHKGYGSTTHIACLSRSVSPLHRRSFEPVRRVLEAGRVAD